MLGVLAFICLGPISAIPAIVCGHVARSEIGKASGTLGGSGMALAGLIMGYAGTVLSILAMLGFLFVIPTVRVVRNNAHLLDAKNSAVSVLVAFKNFQQEYDRFPLGSSKQEDFTFSDDNAAVFDVLRSMPGANPAENPRKIIFLEARTLASSKMRRSGFDSRGTYLDPWGHPYHVRFDGDGDGKVANPYNKHAGPDPLSQPVIVWSLGPDGEPGSHGDGDAKADIISWQ